MKVELRNASLDAELRYPIELHVFSTNNRNDCIIWRWEDGIQPAVSDLDVELVDSDSTMSHSVLIFQLLTTIDGRAGVPCLSTQAYGHVDLAIASMSRFTEYSRSVQLRPTTSDGLAPLGDVFVGVRMTAVDRRHIRRGQVIRRIGEDDANKQWLKDDYKKLNDNDLPMGNRSLLDRTWIPIYRVNGVMLPGWVYFQHLNRQPVANLLLERLARLATLHQIGMPNEYSVGQSLLHTDVQHHLQHMKRLVNPPDLDRRSPEFHEYRLAIYDWMQKFAQTFSNACTYRGDVRHQAGTSQLSRVESFDYLYTTMAGDCEDLARGCMTFWKKLGSHHMHTADNSAYRIMAQVAREFDAWAALVDLRNGDNRDAHMTAFVLAECQTDPIDRLWIGLDGISPCKSAIAKGLHQWQSIQIAARKSLAVASGPLAYVSEGWDGAGSHEEERTTVVREFHSATEKSPVHSAVHHETDGYYASNRKDLHRKRCTTRSMSDADRQHLKGLAYEHPLLEVGTDCHTSDVVCTLLAQYKGVAARQGRPPIGQHFNVIINTFSYDHYSPSSSFPMDGAWAAATEHVQRVQHIRCHITPQLSYILIHVDL